MRKSNIAVACMTTLLLTIIAALWVSEVSAADPRAAGTKGAEVKAVDTKVGDTKTISVYRYNPVGKPDPFQPFIEQEISAEKRLEKIKPLPISPLQRLSIDQFKLVGIAGDYKHRIAMVEDPGGKFYPLSQGTYIGQDNGRVVKILTDRVIVKEKVETSSGRLEVRQIIMKLQKDEVVAP